MRLVHLSDLHLGYRQYQRLTPTGINQREADVAGSLKRAVDRTIELRPDLVLLAGDIFHNVRPTNPAILHAFRQFTRLRQSLPDATMVMVAGNHDTPRSSETGCILKLFTDLGMEVVDAEARRVVVPSRDLAILAVPDSGAPRPALAPDPAYRHNILLLHGEVEGVLRAPVPADRATAEISRAELGASRWDYVALGHYHVYREIAPNAYYSGSIDYTSANTWGELDEERELGVPGKGLIEHDLVTGRHVFHPLAPSRALIALPAFSARGRTASEVDAEIRERVEGCAGGIEDRIVRLVVHDVSRHTARELDYKAVREYKRRAMHFQLELRRPEIIRVIGSAAPGRRPSLKEIVRDRLQSRLLDADVSREALIALGIAYLERVERESREQQLAPAAAEEP
ncbi:MAG TPA: DNA repair exonuclease [Gemmatimonadaceae bacterium]